ncbi:hypothetical protein [Methylobacterium sp. OAE515]|uniref:hypothetical protein n=1 Tax=Methylobacterium sp. OAE515 TaxID=2817895 RepID=UPI001789F314
MVTDTASYTPEGAPVGFVSKAIALPHLGLVFASRGATVARWAFAEELEAFASFDAIVAGAAAALEEAHELSAFGGDFELALMGWSAARRRVELHTLASRDSADVPAFTLQHMQAYFAPMPEDEALRRIGLKVGRTFDVSRPAEKLRQVIELQRDTPAPFLSAAPDAPVGHTIGGAVVLTEVSEAGVTQQVIHRWPDEIGRPLEPVSPRPPQLRIVA